MSLQWTVLLLAWLSLSAAVTILSGPELPNCSTQDLNCSVSTTNCMDPGWLARKEYTPGKPVGLQVSVDTRQDEAGRLHPVLDARWSLMDDGSIHFLKATELHVLVMSTNQNLCVRYSFKNRLSPRSPSGDVWRFSANMLVLDPEQSYRLSVFNIPKPQLGHTPYDVSAEISVPGCADHRMRMTQFCIERGSLWQPNISVTTGPSALSVSFSPDALCDRYTVIVRCSTSSQSARVNKDSQTTLNQTFSLDKWPTSCCLFDVEIRPFFLACGNDCTRRKKTTNICPTLKPKDALEPYVFVVLGLVSMCVVVAVVVFALYRKPGKTDFTEKKDEKVQQPIQPPTVLVIYSQDHPLYKDVVLKLCAFLQVKCGTKVLVDLLDSTSLSMVGRLRWLELQRQQLKDPSDKILVLCSRGVQAKWRAMCAQGQVTLREDVLSPTSDMVTPFLNLFLPDMHQAGMQGKYMVAYFDGIGSEQDVPSVFDIAVKYNLMKHFEELYFRILDIEKYQPGQVYHIEGIGGDEYFNCPSGRALREAIETFQVYQLGNADWFEKECVVSEEEVMAEANLRIDQQQTPSVFECVPLIRDGLPVYVNEVDINENGDSIHIVTPEVNPQSTPSSVAELIPVVSDYKHSSSLDEVLTDPLLPHSHSVEPLYVAEPVFNKPQPPRQNWLFLNEETGVQIPTEDDEEDSLLPINQPSAHSDQRSSVLQNSLDSLRTESSCTTIQSEYFRPSEISHSQPVEMEEDEDLVELSGKGSSSGSDQGYSSKISSQHEAGFKEDPLVALARLQEELFEQNLR